MDAPFRGSFTVAIPAYNEAETLAAVVTEFVAAMKPLAADFEVLIVDDGSSDGTSVIADDLAGDDPHVRVVHHESNRGFSGAMGSCMANAAKEFVVLAPADGQGCIDDLPALLAASAGHDLVFSYRTGRDDSWYRRLTSWAWYSMTGLIFGERLRQFSTLFVFRTAVVREIAVGVRPDAGNFLPMLYFSGRRRGVSIAWIGSRQLARRGGVAKGGGAGNVWRTIRESFKLRRQGGA